MPPAPVKSAVTTAPAARLVYAQVSVEVVSWLGAKLPLMESVLPPVQVKEPPPAPATLTAISRYWNMPAEHLQVAEEICYNGTPNYHERRWAKENGWFTREFTITETSAAAVRSAAQTAATRKARMSVMIPHFVRMSLPLAVMRSR